MHIFHIWFGTELVTLFLSVHHDLPLLANHVNIFKKIDPGFLFLSMSLSTNTAVDS